MIFSNPQREAGMCQFHRTKAHRFLLELFVLIDQWGYRERILLALVQYCAIEDMIIS
jgi:hypothetical protein